MLGARKLSLSQIVNEMQKVDKAREKGKKKNKKSRGMSTWDLDDTLIYSKSGVRYTLPNPSGKPAPG